MHSSLRRLDNINVWTWIYWHLVMHFAARADCWSQNMDYVRSAAVHGSDMVMISIWWSLSLTCISVSWFIGIIMTKCCWIRAQCCILVVMATKRSPRQKSSDHFRSLQTTQALPATVWLKTCSRSVVTLYILPCIWDDHAIGRCTDWKLQNLYNLYCTYTVSQKKTNDINPY